MTEQIEKQLTIPVAYAGQRLDQALATLLPDFSRSKLTQWVKQGAITVNGTARKPKEKVYGHEVIQLKATLEEATEWQAELLTLDVIYEDNSFIIVNKPAKMVVHPAAGNPTGTLVNALLHHAPQLSHLPRAGLIHRLDKDTTGLLVIAKTLTAHNSLVQQLQARTIKREYVALVEGSLTGGGNINKPIGRHPRNRKKMAIVTQGKQAVTHYRILEHFHHFTLLKVLLETGRTHQIRVHMASIHHPLIGDPLYNRLHLPPKSNDTLKTTLQNFKRQALHARQLSFIHPASGKEVSFMAELPDDFQQLLEVIRAEESV